MEHLSQHHFNRSQCPRYETHLSRTGTGKSAKTKALAAATVGLPVMVESSPGQRHRGSLAEVDRVEKQNNLSRIQGSEE